MKFYFSAINLGCSKNLVDLEFTIGQILSSVNKKDIKFFDDPESKQVEYLIVNTCGFLSSSRQEAEETIKYYDDLGKKIILMGCYIPVRDDDFLKSLKNLYKIVPVEESESITKEIFDEKDQLKLKINNFKEKKLKDYLKNLDRLDDDKKAFIWTGKSVRLPFNSSFGHEFVKISEGCDNRCSFCIIPKIRGNQKSRLIEDIVLEIENLVSSGVKEIEIISQDTTRYGTDIYGEPKLFELLESINKISLNFKFRVFYMYPDTLTLDHLKKLKTLEKFIPYFDLPFQHIESKILKRMGRFYDENHIHDLLLFIKSNFENAFLHTNFIVGFPGETLDDFKKLLNFAKKYEFDSVSMFGYHDENLAASSKLDQKVSDIEIQSRVEEMSKLLNEIYDKKDKSRIGRTYNGYVYDYDEAEVSIRWENSAPELDELDIISIKNIISGEIEVGELVEYIK